MIFLSVCFQGHWHFKHVSDFYLAPGIFGIKDVLAGLIIVEGMAIHACKIPFFAPIKRNLVIGYDQWIYHLLGNNLQCIWVTLVSHFFQQERKLNVLFFLSRLTAFVAFYFCSHWMCTERCTEEQFWRRLNHCPLHLVGRSQDETLLRPRLLSLLVEHNSFVCFESPDHPPECCTLLYCLTRGYRVFQSNS